jgi:WD40 repeat protein
VGRCGQFVSQSGRDGEESATARWSRLRRVYDLRNHRTIGSVSGSDVTNVRFAGGQRLLIERKSGNLEIWDERGTAMASVIRGDRAYGYAPAVDRQVKLVARLRDNSAIDIFDIDTGTLLDTLSAAPDSAKAGIAFSPNGQKLAAAIDSQGHNAKLVVRDLSPDALLAAACRAAGSNLSADEWRSLAGAPPAGGSGC